MSATVFYASANELATVTNTFAVAGIATDPTTVSLQVIDPNGVSTTYTYAGAAITKTSTGVYTKDVACATAGPWVGIWTGTGTASDTARVDWTVFGASANNLYCSVADVKSRFGITDTGDDLEVAGAVYTASRAIDEYCGQRFYRDDTATAKRFYPDGGRYLHIGPIATTTGLLVKVGIPGSYSATYTEDTQFLVYPPNALAEGKPITDLVGISGWPCGVYPTVEVTAKWGWPSVPPSVREAALIKAGRLFKRKDTPFGSGGTSDFGMVSISRFEDGDVQLLLSPFQRVMVA